MNGMPPRKLGALEVSELDEISRIPGVGQAQLFARLKYSMRVWYDVQRLISLNVSPSDVAAAIEAQNVQAPTGRIGAPPLDDDQQFQENVQTQGRLTVPRASCWPLAGTTRRSAYPASAGMSTGIAIGPFFHPLAVAQTVGFGPGKSKMLDLSTGID
jgi:hypothetical protein